jgi:SAM-dependent methyltransferase
MSWRDTIISQFRRPRGVLGRLAGFILARRRSNVLRNRWTVDLIDPMSGELVLEVGCGPGVGLELCLSRQSVKAVGLDHSALMIATAAKRNGAAVKAGRLRLIEGTIETLPAAVGPFDKGFSINVIQFVDQAAFVARMRDVLKPGGTLAITYQPRQARGTRADAVQMASALTGLMVQHGFESVRTEELPLHPVSAVCVIGTRR